MDLLYLAFKSNVDIIILPAHCSHVLQPLDVTVNAAIEKHYKRAVSLQYSRMPGGAITKELVAGLLAGPLKEALRVENVIQGFKCSGLWPVNRNAIPENRLVAERRDIQPPPLTPPVPPPSTRMPRYDKSKSGLQNYQNLMQHTYYLADALEFSKKQRAQDILRTPAPGPARPVTDYPVTEKRHYYLGGGCVSTEEVVNAWREGAEKEQKERQEKEERDRMREKSAKMCDHCGSIQPKFHRCKHTVCVDENCLVKRRRLGTPPRGNKQMALPPTPPTLPRAPPIFSGTLASE